jgi:hypothetical protein
MGIVGRRHQCYRASMKELVTELVSKADLSDAQAEKVAGVVKDFILTRLPEALRGPVQSVLTGERVDDVFDAAKSLLGGLLK